jgi:hypothetical protein
MLCYRCGGTGKYLGNGMIMTHCNICNEDKKVNIIAKEANNVKIDKRSKSYIKAIEDIMQLNPDINRREAAKMFDEAYNKS